MRVQVFHLNDRLYFAAPSDSMVPVHLDLAEGIRLERAPHGRLLLTNGKNAWVGVLTLAVRLGWCQLDAETESGPSTAGSAANA